MKLYRLEELVLPEQFIYRGDRIFDFTIDYYILKCDEGFKNKIPTELNEYIKKNNLAEAI